MLSYHHLVIPSLTSYLLFRCKDCERSPIRSRMTRQLNFTYVESLIDFKMILMRFFWFGSSCYAIIICSMLTGSSKVNFGTPASSNSGYAILT